jgi:hypothetical protein
MVEEYQAKKKGMQSRGNSGLRYKIAKILLVDQKLKDET